MLTRSGMLPISSQDIDDPINVFGDPQVFVSGHGVRLPPGGYSELGANHIQVAKSKGVLDVLKILLYPKSLQDEHAAELKKFKQGIIWL